MVLDKTPLGPWICVPNFIAVHMTVFEVFQSGLTMSPAWTQTYTKPVLQRNCKKLKEISEIPDSEVIAYIYIIIASAVWCLIMEGSCRHTAQQTDGPYACVLCLCFFLSCESPDFISCSVLSWLFRGSPEIPQGQIHHVVLLGFRKHWPWTVL